jgi:hypothetical protein
MWKNAYIPVLSVSERFWERGGGIRTALEMIMSRPPSLEVVSWTTFTQSASRPMSWIHVSAVGINVSQEVEHFCLKCHSI